MAVVTRMKCDACGKLAEMPTDDILKGWRQFDCPFGEHEHVDVCSPGCAKLALNMNIDQEWAGEPFSFEASYAGVVHR